MRDKAHPTQVAAVQGAGDHTLHSGEWTQGGLDPIMLSGGETNFQPTCGSTNGAFATFRVSGTSSKPTFTFADEVRPVAGNYVDGNPPQGSFHLGCSVH